MTRARAGLLAFSTGAAVIVGLLWARPAVRRERPVPPRVSVQPSHIFANGFDAATLTIDAPIDSGKPRVTLAGIARGAAVDEIVEAEGKWQAQIRAGILPGNIVVRVQYPQLPAATVELVATATHSDSFADGTPDYLRLDDENDRRAFRRWFTYIAEAQYFQTSVNRPPEINDCAALIRYAYREALHVHDSGWAEAARLPIVPAFSPVHKYQYPYTPLGAALFRVTEGSYRASDLSSNGFAQFADAQTLWRYNTHRVARELAQASPGDLLFFRHSEGRMPFHSMIYLGESALAKNGQRYVLYHTGPDGTSPGEIRRLTIEELLRFPQPEWRPQAGNPYFLGVFRWNILRKVSDKS